MICFEKKTTILGTVLGANVLNSDFSYSDYQEKKNCSIVSIVSITGNDVIVSRVNIIERFTA